MVEEEMVPGDGWVSDDSSFYGDEEERDRLLSICDHDSLELFWRKHAKDLNSIIAVEKMNPPPVMVNPRDGIPNAWQLGETADDFVKRLPPLTTPRNAFDWIWVSNPYPEGQDMPGPSNVDGLVSNGRGVLEQSLQERRKIQSSNSEKSNRSVSEMLNLERKRLQASITELARNANVTSGKWMLFPDLEDLTRVWRTVIEATITNRLGPAAKVAPDEGRAGARLICVYTRDFSDVHDVFRVLHELKVLGLVGFSRPIYYKSDAYTYLNIYGANAAEYGLHASLYSSQSLLASGTPAPSSSAPQKKRTKFDGCRRSTDKMDID